MNAESKSTQQVSIERIGTNGNGLYVQCDWQNDRFRHSLGVIVDSKRYEMMQSQEGSSGEPWPCSPPLQQLHRQTIGENPAILAVGMAGRCHYSTSFLLVEEDFVELQIESACSIPKSERSEKNRLDDLELGTTYRVRQPFVWLGGDDRSLMIQHSDSSGFPAAIISLLETRTVGFETTGKGADYFKLCPDNVHADVATQWKYRIRFL